ncbi:MAG: MFS transporter [Firmicutes bacterium]|nr:MFS transporter [Alicyclobacillaceae bacterium]MCL6498167.1 MFS transporter [Bacillota bacterium]
MSTQPSLAGVAEHFTPERRRYIVGGWTANMLATYDLFLPVVVLPAALSYFEPPNLPAVVQVTVVNITYLISILASPIGGLVLAPLGDRLGRRTLVIIGGAGYALVSLLIALLPGYASWGYGAIAALLILRFIGSALNGTTVGGSVALALEWTPKSWRGLVGGLMGVSPTVGVILTSAVQLIALSIWHGPLFETVGWRFPFYVGAFLGVLLLATVLRSMRDVEFFEQHAGKARAPLREVFSRFNLKTFGQAFMLYTGYLFAIQVSVVFLPPLLIAYLHQPPPMVTSLLLYGNLGILVGGVVMGALSQRIGRRRGLMIGGAWVAVLATLCYYLMVQSAAAKAGEALVTFWGFWVVALSVIPYSAMVLTYLAERYPIHIRATGFTAVITLANIIPGFSSFYIIGLSKIMPYQYAALVLVVVAGLLTLIGALMGPETRDVDMVASS